MTEFMAIQFSLIKKWQSLFNIAQIFIMPLMVKKKKIRSIGVKLLNSILKSLGQYRNVLCNSFDRRVWLSLFVTLYLAALALQFSL